MSGAVLPGVHAHFSSQKSIVYIARCRPLGTALPLGGRGTVASALRHPSRAGAGNAPRKVCPKTAKFGGCPPTTSEVGNATQGPGGSGSLSVPRSVVRSVSRPSAFSLSSFGAGGGGGGLNGRGPPVCSRGGPGGGGGRTLGRVPAPYGRCGPRPWPRSDARFADVPQMSRLKSRRTVDGWRGGVKGAGGFGTRPRYPIVCLWRCLSASRHCSF